MPPIRVLVADDHQVFRQGLIALLEQQPDVAVVGQADRADALQTLVSETPADQLILDLQMERSALADIEALAPRIAIIVLTASEVPADAVAAVRKGARAVVYKRFAVDTVMEAVRTVAGGDVWLPQSLQTHMAAQLRNSAANVLSPREEDVVRCVAAGLRNAEVAQALSISEETVKTHLNRIFRKLGVRDRVELVLYAARSGMPVGVRRDRSE